MKNKLIESRFTQPAYDFLCQLQATGLYGGDVGETVERIVCRFIQERSEFKLPVSRQPKR